ncbi:MAG: hypothetical protein V4463_00965 [Pseudomonadota bacterium]
MSPSSPFDDNIPVLTEVFQESPPKAAVPRLPKGDELVQRALDGWRDDDWEVLERRLSERILQQLQGRVDFVLEQRLRDSMADVLQHALAGLTAEIRTGLQETIEKIVARAVAQEITHLQASKK